MEITLEKYKAAYREVSRKKAKTGFYTHLIIYVMIVPLFWLLNYYTSTAYWWAIWPTLGWGSGLLSHWYFGVKRIGKELDHYEREAEKLAVKQ